MNAQYTGKADYSYWLSVRIWSAEEAAALLLGYEPDYASYHRSIPFLPNDDDPPEDLHRKGISVEREMLERILTSAQLAGELGKVELNQGGGVWGNTVSPFDWMAWAKRNDIDCAEALADAAAKFDAKSNTDQEDLHPRLKVNLYRIIGALLQELMRRTEISQSAIIDELVDLHGHKAGISKSNLEKQFSVANSWLDNW